MKKLVALAALTPTVLLAFSVHAAKWEATTAERQEMLRSVKVWKDPGNIASKDLLQGPGDKYRIHQQIDCKFYDSFFDEVSDTGKTEKFWCLEPGKSDRTKVKYDTSNGEVFAEVVSSRILGAIGFFTDTAYPISVACENCPEEPWRYMNYMAQYHNAPSSIRARGQSNEERIHNASVYLERAQRTRTQNQQASLQRTGQPYKKMFEVALSEKKYSGKAIYSPEQRKAGIGLNELGAIDASRGGSTAAEIDALKLAVAFIKHGDNKADNQRLVCPDENVVTGANGRQSCTSAHLVLQDIGSTMGIGVVSVLGIDIGPNESAKLSYEGWQKTAVWKDAASCRANLGDNMIGGTLSDPTVSEAGRQLLAGLLMQLTDRQLSDVFTAARVDKRTGQRAYSVDQWVQLFKAKRAEIANARCPQ